MNKGLRQEVEQGKKIKDNAEAVWRWDSPTGVIRANRRADYFFRLGEISHSSSVLELGCGTGLFTKLVYEKSKANITAIDVSEDLLSMAKKQCPYANFVFQDAMNLSFENNFFDCVYGSSVLHHLDMAKAIENIYRVLKPKGKMVFAEPNMLNPHIFLQKNVPAFKKYWGDIPDETAIVRWKLKNLMEQKGFKNVKIIPYDFLYPLTPDSLISFVIAVGSALEKIPIVREIAGSVIIYGEK